LYSNSMLFLQVPLSNLKVGPSKSPLVIFSFLRRFLANFMKSTVEPIRSSKVSGSFSAFTSDEVFLIWKAFGRITRDLGSFEQDYGPTPTLIKNFSTVARDGVTDIM
ncbi:hypothetical protein Tco_1509334, partial [Tanacetum coccineum]